MLLKKKMFQTRQNGSKLHTTTREERKKKAFKKFLCSSVGWWLSHLVIYDPGDGME